MLRAPLPAGGVGSASGKAGWPHLLRKVPSPPLGLLEGFQEINAHKDASPSLPGKEQVLGEWALGRVKAQR